MFRKKKAAAPAKGAEGRGDNWGIRGPYVATKIKMKGDIEIMEFRKKVDKSSSAASILTEDRKYFNGQLTKLAQGYKSGNKLSDFIMNRTLGTGSFGRVLMAEPKTKRGDFMAMKIIAKDRVIKTRQVEHTYNEKNILFCTQNHFIARMTDYFADKKSLYMVLEFVNGGEMFTHIQKQKRRHFAEAQVKFFAVETILAFEYLHNLDIIFRDLKPENLLIDYKGHIRLTDFGFAKRCDDRTFTMCGTPEYLAPEIIVNKGYNHAVDWWAVGVLIYEMGCGRSPFEDKSQLGMFKKIAARRYKCPRTYSAPMCDCIDKLLQVDLTQRLGNKHGGVREIKDLEWFRGVRWETFEDPRSALRDVNPTYCPKTTGRDDVSQFDEYPEEAIHWYEGKDKYDDTFVGF